MRNKVYKIISCNIPLTVLKYYVYINLSELLWLKTK